MIEVWVDGLCGPINPGGTGCFGYIIKRNGETLEKHYDVIGSSEDMTNNVAEYTALVRVLERIRSLKLDKEKIVVKADSKLVAYGMGIDPVVRRSWKIKALRLLPLHAKAKKLANGMDITFQWVQREENEEADRLCRLAYESLRT
jgi:ribonuclease HI